MIFTRKAPCSGIAVFTLLLVFTLASGAEPPVTRALAAFALGAFSDRFRLGWTSLQIVTASGCCTLLFCSDLYDAQSLLLSWTASLAITGFSRSESSRARRHERVWQSLRPHVLTHLIMCPLLLPLSVPHPSAILCNWLVAPVLGLVLFPASLLAFLHPDFAAWINPLWSAFTFVIAWLAERVPEGSHAVQLPSALLWGYLIAMNLVLLAIENRDATPHQARAKGR